MLVALFQQGGKGMAQSAKIRPEQISRARKLLQDLPKKDNKKTRPEAAKLLEKDFRKAMQKRYSEKRGHHYSGISRQGFYFGTR